MIIIDLINSVNRQLCSYLMKSFMIHDDKSTATIGAEISQNLHSLHRWCKCRSEQIFVRMRKFCYLWSVSISRRENTFFLNKMKMMMMWQMGRWWWMGKVEWDWSWRRQTTTMTTLWISFLSVSSERSWVYYACIQYFSSHILSLFQHIINCSSSSQLIIVKTIQLA